VTDAIDAVDAVDAVEECMLCRPEIADAFFTRVRL